MIYLDNAATSYPKPQNVRKIFCASIEKYAFNSGRGAYAAAVRTSEAIYDVRMACSRFFGAKRPENVIFTPGCTWGLNTVIKGLVQPGSHVVISSLEHNAVARPVRKLCERNGVQASIAEYDEDPQKTVQNFENCIRKNTRLIVCTHASNVFGMVMPIQELAQMAAGHGIPFAADCAQTAGVMEVKMYPGLSALCAPCHKGLLGAPGAGILLLSDSAPLPDTLVEGGTGSLSAELRMPPDLPERFEAGTLNNCAILSAGAGIRYIEKRTPQAIYAHETALCEMLFEELSKAGAVLYTPRPQSGKSAPILSLNWKDYPSEKTAALLSEKGIAVRAGLHCAPIAHRFMGTLKRGTVRLSPGCFTQMKECEYFINTLKKL